MRLGMNWRSTCCASTVPMNEQISRDCFSFILFLDAFNLSYFKCCVLSRGGQTIRGGCMAGYGCQKGGECSNRIDVGNRKLFLSLELVFVKGKNTIGGMDVVISLINESN